MQGSNIQNPGSSIQEEVTKRGVQKCSALKKTESQTWKGNAVKKFESPLFVDSVSRMGQNFNAIKDLLPAIGGQWYIEM